MLDRAGADKVDVTHLDAPSEGGHAMNAVSIQHRCPKAPCRTPIRTDVASAGRVEVRCPACGEEIALDVPAELANERKVVRCAACPGREFFVRRDFPQRLGLALVVGFGLAATAFYYYENILATFGTLAALVVVDAILFLFVGKVTVCYRCRAEYRGAAYNPDHEGFDLATSEKYQ